ncbi:MAG TPA: 16S rRNA (adenine(1518)-N(6)/adenine(1519)-N(6))-dimethyltransferase RsmA [bacterium]|nr:16S rRNA (adenine(1518)-N(6)/adenine(1519)-N(6))-dimethyltransferase RsmA [bacterium]
MGRRLGQHLLRSPAVLQAIARLAAVQPGERVLEVGPGMGALTEVLLAAGAYVTAVEVDPAFAQSLGGRWGQHERFRLIQADVRKLDLDGPALFGSTGSYAVIANLPYYLTTPLLFRFIRQRAQISRMLLMVQREVAQRLVAAPGSGHAYGSLSVAAQIAFTMRLALHVPPGAFAPPPKVHSAVVQFLPRPALLPAHAEAEFLEHVQGLFSFRRKRLMGTLQRHDPPWPAQRLALAAPLVGERRPETLSALEHLRVFCLLRGLPAPADTA